MNALGEVGGLVEDEAGSEEGSLEEEVCEVTDGLVSRVGGNLAAELLDDGVVRVELESLLGRHVGGHGRVAEGLGLHDTFHVGGPAKLTGDKDARRIGDTVGDDNLFDLFAECFLDDLAEILVLLNLLLTFSLLLFSLLKLESFFGDTNELLAFEFLELSDGVFVNGVDEEEHFKALLLEDLKERRVLGSGKRLSSEVVDGLLDFGHASDVVLEGGQLVSGLGGMEAEELGQLGAVLSIFMDTQLNVLAEG